ncbi:PREDICTED: RAN GTPase-activating protein 2-like [Camelina sativa]|uniref:RAN GTPase-activating protein 2-like n=1 Tax=Camelina sativa TaxID=90675 RepID=A0ABM1RBE0_CAMSA|nr:PREDICTED: RAN GTPase-activating protein 2-like [Camelina sativa]
MDHSIKVGVSMSKVFSSFNFLTVINLSYTKLENEGAIAFVNALKSSAPSLEVIELAGNNITDEAAPAIAACLAAKRHLKKLNLSQNDLEDEGCVDIVEKNEGAIAFVNALKSSAPSLEVIELAGNNITDEAAPAIAACLAAKRHLKKLNLSQNDLEDQGCVDIVESMEDLELEYVDMSYNKLTRGGALNLAHIVVTKESLKMLNIDGNMISIRGIEEVKEVFKNCPKLLGPLDEMQNDSFGEDYEDYEENYEDYEDYEGNYVDDDDDLREWNDLEDFEDEFVSYFIYY